MLGQLTESEGVLTAEAVMDPSRRDTSELRRLAAARPLVGRHVVILLDIAGGRLAYAISRQRRRKAGAAAKGTSAPAAMAV